MRFMRIVLPSALPPAPYAAELAKILPEHAPILAAWLARAHHTITAFDPETSGCTAFEAWKLEKSGYAGQTGLPLGAGLGPLYLEEGAMRSSAEAANHRAPATAALPDLSDGAGESQAVWLADYVHLALGTDQATLLPRSGLDITAPESQALFDALAPVFLDSGFAASLAACGRLRVTLPAGFAPKTASPDAVAGHPLHAWWQTDAASRPWRRVLNEVQMVWHDHNVNEDRQARGALPVNGLWLYGGATPWESVAHPAPADAVDEIVDERLIAPARMGDWAAWLNALERIDAERLAPLALPDGTPGQPVSLVLLGDRRTVRLTLAPRPAWLRWLPQSNKNWNHWWSLPA